MYHSGRNPLRKVTRTPVDPAQDTVDIARGERRRRLHKAFLRYHDPANWPLLRDALKAMGRADLIGNGRHQLIPTHQPIRADYHSPRRKNSTAAGEQRSTVTRGRVLTQHTGLPPRVTGAAPAQAPAAWPAAPARSAKNSSAKNSRASTPRAAPPPPVRASGPRASASRGPATHVGSPTRKKPR
jgi:hypothetical protein